MFKGDDSMSAGKNKFRISVSAALHHGNSITNYH